MKNFYVSGLREGMKLTTLFLVKKKDSKTTKSNKPFLVLWLGDRTGDIKAIVWDDAEEAGRSFSANDFIEAIDAKVDSYQGELQLSIKRVRKVEPDQVDISDFQPALPTEVVDALFAELEDICRSLSDRDLRRLLGLFFEDQAFVAGLKRAPAAKAMHHVYLGGLLEHTLSVVKIARGIADHYTCVDRDMLIAGAFLHDMGKIKELEYSSGFDYTDEGNLVGHLLLGLRMLDEKIAMLPDFPAATAVHLRHIIASHHGVAEFGSPKEPRTPEAAALHLIDNIDAKVWEFVSLIDSESDQPGSFTSFHRALGLSLFKRDGERRPQPTYGFRMEKPQEGRPAPWTEPAAEAPAGASLDLFGKPKK